jgi:hypothetical protein
MSPLSRGCLTSTAGTLRQVVAVQSGGSGGSGGALHATPAPHEAALTGGQPQEAQPSCSCSSGALQLMKSTASPVHALLTAPGGGAGLC